MMPVLAAKAEKPRTPRPNPKAAQEAIASRWRHVEFHFQPNIKAPQSVELGGFAVRIVPVMPRAQSDALDKAWHAML
jgi:hypothetical protein